MSFLLCERKGIAIYKETKSLSAVKVNQYLLYKDTN